MSRKYFLKVENSFYNFDTGEKVDILSLPRGAEIVIFTHHVVHQRKRTKGRAKYIYRLKKTKEYLLSNELTTTFLREVLFDYFDTNAVVLSGKKIFVVFFGEQQEWGIAEGEERIKALERIYQGIPYVEVDIEQAIKLVKKRSLLLLFIVLGIFTVGGIFIYNFLFAPPDIGNVPRKKIHRRLHTPIRINPEKLKILRTRKVIETLAEVQKGLKPWWYIKSIDFGRGEIRIRSLLPDEGFKKVRNWYEGKVKVPVKVSFEKEKVTALPWKECLIKFANYNATIERNLQTFITIDIDKEGSWKEVSDLLNTIYNCPASAQGSIVAQKNPEKVFINLKITLYKRGGEK
jgi:hypothetical protein